MTHISESQTRLRRLLVAALFVALAYVSRFVLHFDVAFLTFECKDALIAVGGIFLGPLWALGMSLATAIIEFVTISNTGWYGFVMNFCAAAAFSCVASLVYRFRRTLGGAIAGLCGGVVALVAVMLPLNLLVTPVYMGVAVSQVVALIPELLLPFNLLKGVMNMAIVLLLYKPLTRALRATHLADGLMAGPRATSGAASTEDGEEGEAETPLADHPREASRHRYSRWLTPLLGVVLLVTALLVFFLVLHGKVVVGK